MNQFIFILCLVIFLCTPPIIILIRYTTNKPSWWLIYLIIVVVGWLSVFGTVIFYYKYLGDEIKQLINPPNELIECWANDGAKKVFALLFGWSYSLIYSLPWLFLYYVSITIRKRSRNASIA